MIEEKDEKIRELNCLVENLKQNIKNNDKNVLTNLDFHDTI